MTFHRLTTPSYFGGLPGGYDYINNALAGTPAPANGVLAGGPNVGSYFVGFGDNATSANINRPAAALAQNTDALDDLFHRDIATAIVTSDVTAGSPVTSITLVGPGIFLGSTGTANTQAGIGTFIRVVDSNDQEIFQVIPGFTPLLCAPTSVTLTGGDAVGSNGFSANSVQVNIPTAIPTGTTYRVYYYVRSNLAAFDVASLVFGKRRRWNLAAAYSGPSNIGPNKLVAGTTQLQTYELLDILNGVDAVRTSAANTTLNTNSPGAQLRDGTVVLNAASSFNIQLPNPASCAGQKVLLIDGTGSMGPSNTVTLVRFATEKISNIAANGVLGTAYGEWWLVSDGTNWHVRQILHASPDLQGCRLSATSEPIAGSDTTSATSIFFCPYTSARISLWDGTHWVERQVGNGISAISLALSALTNNTNYDVYAAWSAPSVILELVPWTNDITRSVALTAQDGVFVKTGDFTRRYVGTIRTIATNATADSPAQRFVWNHYHRQPLHGAWVNPANSWSIAPVAFAGWRPVNNNTNPPQVEFVVGLNVHARAQARYFFTATTNGWVAGNGIGVNSTGTNAAQIFGALTSVANATSDAVAVYEGTLLPGHWTFTQLEQATGAGGATVTYFGNAGNATFMSTGLLVDITG